MSALMASLMDALECGAVFVGLVLVVGIIILVHGILTAPTREDWD